MMNSCAAAKNQTDKQNDAHEVVQTRQTSEQSNLAMAASSPHEKSGPASYVPWVLTSLHPKQNLDPLSRVCTAKPRDIQTD